MQKTESLPQEGENFGDYADKEKWEDEFIEEINGNIYGEEGLNDFLDNEITDIKRWGGGKNGLNNELVMLRAGYSDNLFLVYVDGEVVNEFNVYEFHGSLYIENENVVMVWGHEEIYLVFLENGNIYSERTR